jgi:uncharacterized protein
MSGTASPREVFERLSRGITEGRWADLADLYAEDAVAEMPLAAPERGRVAGREVIRSHFLAAAGGPLQLSAGNVVVHETTDPEVIIAEFDYDVLHVPTGRRLTAANVQILRIRNGLILSTRDYHDHLRLAAAGGRAEELAAALRATVATGNAAGPG